MDTEFENYILYEDEYRYFIKKYSHYSEDENSNLIKFNYMIPQEYSEEISKKYGIVNRIAHVEDEIKKIKKAMFWVNLKVVLLTNKSKNIVKGNNILEIISEINKDGKSSNCLKNARVMTQLLLCSGIKARTIICLPIGTFPYDNHCVTEAYINKYKKWIVIDPTYNLFFLNDNGGYMSIENIREAIVNDRNINPIFNEMYGISKNIYIENNYLKYMTKNLFRFRTYEEQFDWNTQKNTMFELVPKDYTLDNYCIEKNECRIIMTTNEKKFWRG